MFKFRTVDYKEEKVPMLPSKLVPFFMYFVKQMKGQFLTILLLFLLSNILVAIVPYFVKIMVEGFEQSAANPEQLFDILLWPIIFFIVFILIVQPVSAQIGNYIQARTLPVFANMVRRQVALYMHNHSYGYYQNDYAGRLAGKVVETPSAMLDCLYVLLGAIWYALISYVVSIWLYATVSPSFGIVALLSRW
jgi:ABC-type multidrug transport system fused ATPase/permease subunit